jgi:hypothetical protein
MSANQRSTLSILQYNVQKSYDVMNLLLRNKKSSEFDIIAIQEPWLNDHDQKLTHNPSLGRFKAYMGGAGRPLVAFLINSKINPTTIRVTGRSEHLCSLHITLTTGDGERTVTIHNIYNPHQQGAVYTEGRWEGVPTESAIPELDVALSKYNANDQVVVGDFNLYHESWFGDLPLPIHGNRKRAQAEALINIMGSNDMQLTLPPGTVTRPRSDIRSELIGTALDLSWCTEDIAERILTCKTREDLDMASDHIPVETVILIDHTPTPNRIGKDFTKTDGKLFLETLAFLLPDISNITTREHLDQAVDETIKAIQTAADTSTPDRVISVKSIPGFTKECKEAIAEVKKTRRRWRRPGSTEEDLIEFQTAKSRRRRAIAIAQRNIHRKKVSEVKDEKGLWSLARWTRNRGSKAPAFTPDIKKSDGTMAEETHEKTEALRQTFFPQPPVADLSDTHYYAYSRPSRGLCSHPDADRENRAPRLPQQDQKSRRSMVRL